MKTLRTLTNNVNERINGLSREDYLLAVYCIGFMVSWMLDSIYCRLLAWYYKCPVGQYDRNGWIILLSMLFGIVDFFFAYKVFHLVRELPATRIEITTVNGCFIKSVKVKGIKKLLKPVAIFVMALSIISLLFDLFEVFNSFLF